MADPRPATGVIVTGGASGIGAACAEVLAAEGRPVAIWDLRGAPEAAEGIAARTGAPVVGFEVDVCDAQQIDEATQRSREALDVIGGLVHAAGIAAQTPL